MKTSTVLSRQDAATWIRTSLPLAVMVALCGTCALDASAAPLGVSPITTVAHPTVLRQGDAVIGALPMATPIHIEVALKLRNKDVLDAFIANNAKNQARGLPAQLMTSDQVLANHAPTQAQARAVADYLTSRGFKNVVIAPNRLLVSADGTALTAGNAFMTAFAQVQTHDGRIAFANTDEVRIPAALGDKVLAVVGLQTVHQASADTPTHTDVGQTTFVMTHDPMEFASIYSSPSVNPGVVVGIVSSSSVSTPTGGLIQAISDLNTFTATHGLQAIPIKVVNTNGAPSGTAVDQLSDLESQNIVGMAGGHLGKLIFYNIPDTSDASLTADFNRIVALNETKIIEDSFGVCETDAQADGSAAADDAIFQIAVVQGQTFAVSTGSPAGADQCRNLTNTPLWPASSQYVVAVAGTLLSASATAWGNEKVYNASGGSPSTFEPMPSWQSAFGVPGTTRSAVDVAFDSYPGSGSKVVVNNAIQPLGGNALAASLFAGAWAYVLNNRGSGFGFAAPVIYALPTRDFHDITVGNNDGGRPALGFSAGPGYDFPSGRGSMIVNNVLADSAGLGNQPPQASFQITTVLGRTARFHDTSTDSDSALATHFWNFGDGTTEHALNPNHLYAARGTYSVSETVTDTQGTPSTATQSLTLGPLQLIQSPGFERTSVGWVATGNSRFDCDNPGDHDDGSCVWFMYTFEAGGTLAQTVTIPAYERTATLAFDLRLLAFTSSATRTDLFKVVINNAAGTPIATLATFSNLDGSALAFLRHTYDMTPFIGQTVQIEFIATSPTHANDGEMSLDDVT
jgi:subtilase family serine protease